MNRHTIDLDRNRSRHRPVRADDAGAARRRRRNRSRRSSSPASATRRSSRSSPSATRTHVVEVITAEDIGKMPDKNVADSLSRVPASRSAPPAPTKAASTRTTAISMRGTNPSLTQTLINGHNVASGDWFVLNQVGTVGRSVSYSLLPSELVDQVVVHKSSRGHAGRRRRGRHRSTSSRASRSTSMKQFTIGGSVGAVYADLPDEDRPADLACWSTGRTTTTPSA